MRNFHWWRSRWPVWAHNAISHLLFLSFLCFWLQTCNTVNPLESVPTLISWDKRCWAHQMNKHFLPVLLPATNLLFPLVWNILLERFSAVYSHVVLWWSVTCSCMLNIFQLRGRVFKCHARVKHLWILGGIKALSAPNLWLAVSRYNTSRLLKIAVANCFLD